MNFKANGLFFCSGSDNVSARGILYDVDVEFPPKIKHKSSGTIEELSVFVGNTISLNCASAGNPVPNFRWLKDSDDITPDYSTDILIIKYAKLDDNRIFECEARNDHGVDRKRFNVTVNIKYSYGNWSDWGECDRKCGKGKQKRQRSCVRYDTGKDDYKCPGRIEERDCYNKC